MGTLIVNQYQKKGDPYFSDVVLLLKGEGGNGSTNILDSSSVGHDISVVGSANISTASSKFGSSSIRLNGGRLTLDNSLFLFGTNDFTVETWAKFEAIGSFNAIAGIWDGADAGSVWLFTHGSSVSSDMRFGTYVDGLSFTEFDAGVNTVSWDHIAICRSGSVLRFFRNGIFQGAIDPFALNLYEPDAVDFVIGSVFNGQFKINAYIQDFRVTKNIARYTANFSPPTEPFKDY